MKNAVGFTPKKGLLSGLRGDSNATQAARGQAMAASATVSYTHLTLPTKRIV